MNGTSLVTALLAYVALLISYVGLWQKREEVERARPILRIGWRKSDDGGNELVVVNDGEGAALAVTLRMADAEIAHRDVLASGAEVVWGLSDDLPDEVAVDVVFRGLTGFYRQSRRKFRRGSDKSFELVGGEDIQLGWFWDYSVPIGERAFERHCRP